MKTKIFMKVAGWHTLLCIAGLSLLLSGCENPMSEQELSSTTVFTATIDADEPATRTLLGNAASPTDPRDVLWKEGDELIVGGATYKLSSGANTTTATLTPKFASQLAQKDPVTGKYEAYYPTLIYNGGTPTLRDTQTYAAPETVGSEKFVVASHLPMYAQSETTELSFKNLCAVLNFKLTGTDKVTKVVVTSATQNLSGPFDNLQWNNGNPTFTMSGTAAADKKVTLDCSGVPGGGVQLDAAVATEFCIAVPAADYAKDDLTVQVFGPGDTEIMPSFKNSVSISQLKRSEIYDIKKQVKAAVFDVEFVTTPTMSPTYDTGTNTITLFDLDSAGYVNPSLGSYYDTTLTFKVTTNLGYEITNSTSPLYQSKSGTVEADPGPGISETTFRIRIYKVPAAPTRGELSTDPGLTVMKPFSVSATRQVYFSPGNLQYRGATATWRFAQRQWDYVGSTQYDYGTVYYEQGGVRTKSTNDIQDKVNTWKTNDLRKAYDGWIDLFGWGTTGKEYRTSSCIYPWSWVNISGYESYYGPVSGDLEGDSDWGVNMGEGYRTPSVEEMQYILAGRNDTFKYMGVAIRFDPAMAFTITVTAKEDPSYMVEFTVSVSPMGVRGLILFPDNFAADNAALAMKYDGVKNGQTDWHTPVTESDWLDLQSVGCVFLPFSGSREGTSYVSDFIDNYNGAYWLKDRHYSFGIHDSRYHQGSWFDFANPHPGTGYAVRLVKNVTP